MNSFLKFFGSFFAGPAKDVIIAAVEQRVQQVLTKKGLSPEEQALAQQLLVSFLEALGQELK